jgi:hypothetical protein
MHLNLIGIEPGIHFGQMYLLANNATTSLPQLFEKTHVTAFQIVKIIPIAIFASIYLQPMLHHMNAKSSLSDTQSLRRMEIIE